MCKVKNHASCVIEPRKIIFYHAKRCVTLRQVSLTLGRNDYWNFCRKSPFILWSPSADSFWEASEIYIYGNWYYWIDISDKENIRRVIFHNTCLMLLYMSLALALSTQENRDTDTSHLCDKVETKEHMIWCSHYPIHKGWRNRTINRIQGRLHHYHLEDSVINVISTSICMTNWLDIGDVQVL